MLKPISAMTDHEMLVELMEEKRRNDRIRTAKLIVFCIVLVILIYLGIKYLPPIIRYFRSLNDTINQIQEGVDQVQGLTDSVINSVNSLLEKIGGIFHW